MFKFLDLFANLIKQAKKTTTSSSDKTTSLSTLNKMKNNNQNNYRIVYSEKAKQNFYYNVETKIGTFKVNYYFRN